MRGFIEAAKRRESLAQGVSPGKLDPFHAQPRRGDRRQSLPPLRGWLLSSFNSQRSRAGLRSHAASRLAALIVLVLIAYIGYIYADTLTGEVRGGVLDVDSKTALPDATMTLVNSDRSWRRQGTTDPDGNYVFIQLEPGNYSVTAEKEGYYSSERTDILIRLNQPKVVIPPFELRRLVS